MKTLWLSLILALGVNLFAQETSLFRDEDSGLVLEIPPGFKQTWNISNLETGLEMTVFNSDGRDTDVFMIMIGKLPLISLWSEPMEAFYPIIMSQIEEVLSLGKIYVDKDGVVFQAETLPGYSSDCYFGKRIRMFLGSDEMFEELFMDVHFFIENQQACAVVTGVFPDADEEDLDAFSQSVLESVRFVTQ